MGNCRVILLIVLALVASSDPVAAIAQNGPGFKTPSNNIFCIIVRPPEEAPISYLRCDIMQVNSTAVDKPEGCTLNWGDAFLVAQNGDSGARICHGDTAKNNNMRVLPYGRMWKQESFTCASQADSLTCTNTKGHGFMLSRSLQRVF